MSELSDRLNEAKGDLSVAEMVRRMRAAGFTTNRATVYRYLSGKPAKAPDEPTLEALSIGFGVSVKELRRLSGLPSGGDGPWLPPDEASRLNEEQRAALDQLIRAIVRSHGAPMSRAGVSPADESDSQQMVEDDTRNLVEPENVREPQQTVPREGRGKRGRPRVPPPAINDEVQHGVDGRDQPRRT
jgi:transcriptional regulator with XRE-family HTH domain